MSNHKIEITPELFKNKIFVPHGNYAARSEGQLVLMDATGPFNTEIMLLYHQITAPLFTEVRSRGPMVTLVEFHESMMMCQEAVTLLRDSILHNERNDAGNVAAAYVVAPNVEGRALMVARIANEVFAQCKCEFAAFYERAPAIEWLEGLLAAANATK